MYRPFDEFHVQGRCISVIGSGGKTAFLRMLSGCLPGTVILTTSTHIFPFPDFPLIKVPKAFTPESREQVLFDLRSALARSRVVCLGKPELSGKLADPSPVISFEDLLCEADQVLVEADGSAGRPLKAHRPWEPVIPACSDWIVCLVGASGIGRPVSEACHCPDLFASLAGISVDTPATPEHIAAVLNREALADCYLINQVDALPDPAPALRLCNLLSLNAYPCSVGIR